MDRESLSRKPERKVSIKNLLKSCQELADVLSDGGWSSRNKGENTDEENDIRHVRTSREFSERIGCEITVNLQDIGPTEVQPVQITTEASFIGDKNQYGYIDDEQTIPYLEEIYTVGVTITDTVEAFELPDRVVDGLVEIKTLEDGKRIGVPISKEKLQTLKLQRQAEMSYIIDDGCIEEHVITYRYLCEGMEVNKQQFSWSESHESFEPTDWKGRTNEFKKDDMSAITPEEEVWVHANIDRVIETIVMDKQFEEIETSGAEQGGMYLSEKDHCQRAMAILALAGHGLKGVRF